MMHRQIDRTEWALRERVKELTCLYGIANIMQQAGLSTSEALQEIAEILPEAWQFPGFARARITLDDRSYESVGFAESTVRQVAEFSVGGKRRGAVEVCYVVNVAQNGASPFLPEEKSLIDMVAREVSHFLERREAEDANLRLRDQLRHADRLATLGQLAAGVAHEINEPLANILGFAQLAKKTPELPKRAADDLDKIVTSCLHAREVILKLLTFARQMPPSKSRVALNQVVADGLYFLESRCAKAGIQIVRELDPQVPEIEADGAQVHQVLVNLVVNAVQAMPEGGTLTIATKLADDTVHLIVDDTGVGMSEEVKQNIFTPFFTTKDVNEGTGLGLSVVDGIIASHGGSISVTSEPGQGSRFEIQLPRTTTAEKNA